MAEPAESVQREARQLVEAAARWLSAVPDASAVPDEQEYAGGTGAQEGSAESGAPERAPDEVGAEELGPHEFGAEGFGAGEFGGEETTLGPPSPDREEHLCRGCPWCRAKAAAGPIGADTLDSLAQLLGAAAESLTLFAQSRRDAAHAERDEAADGAADDDDLADGGLAADDMADDDTAENDQVSTP